jgi:hypothetical protein
MSDITIVRYRLTADLIAKIKKPLPDSHIVTIGDRSLTYLRVGAVEGFEDKLEVVFDEEYRHVSMHHHDARFDMCRPCARHAQDSLGNIE